MALESQFKITEIICLRSKDLETGRSRILRPTDYEDVSLWERIVEEAENSPKNFEIRREEVVTENEQADELSRVTVGELYRMSREKVSRVAAFYGIPDEGQKRNALLDILAPQVRAAHDRMKQNEGGSEA